MYRRRRTAVAHRRQRLLWRLLRPLGGALLVVGVPAAAAYWAATTPYLRVAEIRVSGTDRVSAAWVTDALSSLRGEHLLWTGLDDVRRRLASHEWIRDVAVRKELPDCLYVAVEERRPEALLRIRSELYFVERDARIIAEYDERLLDEPLLILEAPVGARYEVAPALELAAAWRRLDPPWSGPISEIEIVGDNDFLVHAEDVEFPIMVSSDNLESGLDRLSWLLPELDRRYAAVASVDVRFSRQIVFQPAAGPQREEG
jgi:cell division protein FtsQ